MAFQTFSDSLFQFYVTFKVAYMCLKVYITSLVRVAM